MYPILDTTLRGLTDLSREFRGKHGEALLPSPSPLSSTFMGSAERAVENGALSPSIPPHEYANACLFAQKERVKFYADFAPLLVPFFADRGEFQAWWWQQSGGRGALLNAAAQATEGGEQYALEGAETVLRSLVAALNTAAKSPPPPPSSPTIAKDAPILHKSALDISVELRSFYIKLEPAFQQLLEAWSSSGTSAEPPEIGAIKVAAAANQLPSSALMVATRFALTGMHVGASLTDTLRLLGRKKCVERISDVLVIGTVVLPAAPSDAVSS